MERGFLKGLIVGFGLTFVACSFFVWVYLTRDVYHVNQLGTEKGDAYSKINLLIDYIDTYYYDEYDLDDVYESMYSGLVQGLGDKYSMYYSIEAYEELAQQTAGQYVGIGATITYSEDGNYPMILAPIEDGPADKIGLLPMDIIVEVDGVSTYQQDLDTAVSKIKGKAGTEVVLTIYREGESDYLEFTIVRASVEIKSVSAEVLEDNIGYVAVSSFDSNTDEQFDKAITELINKGVDGIVIDLRNNPGGLLDTSCNMLDRILPAEKLLVYMLDKDDNKSGKYSRDKDTVDIPISVIINEASASASEVFAGCLKDYDKAVIVGEQSFGKGIVQTLYSLPDGTRIKLTTHAYFSPEGNNIHGTGITPDVVVSDDIETEEDEQLKAAIEALK